MSNVFNTSSNDNETSAENTLDVSEETHIENQPEENDGDFPYTPKALKVITQELLKNGLIESANKPDLYQRLLSEKNKLSQIFEPLDLHVSHDEMRGIAYLTVLKNDEDNDDWSHPLVRKKPLTLEQSLLVAILRQYYITYELDHGLGSADISIGVEELLSLVNTYYGHQGSESADQKRLSETLSKLKEQGIVSAVNKYEQVTIRPIIVHVANHENLTLLLNAMSEKTIEKLEQQANAEENTLSAVESDNNE
ncbi:MAG: DUF4194 domain-containing protein [Sinobacterium sp.]|nr:DUF4194 domain-containing protein [Sinobacterium sp.]